MVRLDDDAVREALEAGASLETLEELRLMHEWAAELHATAARLKQELREIRSQSLRRRKQLKLERPLLAESLAAELEVETFEQMNAEVMKKLEEEMA